MEVAGIGVDVKRLVEIWIRQECFAGYDFLNRVIRLLVFFCPFKWIFIGCKFAKRCNMFGLKTPHVAVVVYKANEASQGLSIFLFDYIFNAFQSYLL